ncbi:SDR family oxidoreductase [Rhodococcus sp. KBS0724]|jgi:3-oxoacyl-[acyl-carrier protein] reductase|uniref:SDR family NAD(P)-dependent oxidoreductase n=1 Tax=Rhodococcus sp. KBS0724 TaxID=1179674 RepID=UPI00110F29F0|nr:SDR family oxidoreductase [Rhodococcus sp. KBS0724]TSD40229.1 SDR family oxidoreductase [Rhodococcus sp. KBS0724]
MYVLITGGATGIGKAIAAEFRSIAGTDIVITGRTESALQATAAELDISYVVCDHSSPEDVSRAAQRLPADLDVIVNNAGGNAGFDKEAQTGLAGVQSAWLENYVANVLTAVLTVGELGSRINDGGRIINIGSIAAENGSGSYGAAKAAVGSWTVGLAKEFGHRGITANTIAPGYIGDTDFFKGQLTRERERDLISLTQNGRRGTPADIAAVARFLASPGAAHITGQTLHVNGGVHTTR